jgi:hypothetical protein
MAVTIQSGDLGYGTSSQAVLANRKVIQMKDKIFLLEPSANPLTLFLQKLNRESVGAFKFEMLEDRATPLNDRVNNASGHASTITEIDVDNGAYFQVDDIVICQRTGETMKVTSVSSNTVTLSRTWGTVAAQALVDNDQLTILGSARSEFATANTSVSTKLTTLSNYTQTFRDPFAVSRRLLKSELYGGNILAYLHRARMIEHAKDIEISFLFGEKNVTGTDPTSTGGLNEFVSTNSTAFGGAIGSLEEVFSASEGDFRYGSGKKVMFAGYPVVSNISLLAENSLQTVPPVKTFGISVKSLVTPFGEYMIVPHKLMEGDTWKKQALIADLSNLGYRYLKDSDTQLRTNIQAPDADGRKDEILSDVGLFRVLEETHAKWTGAAS